MKSLMLYFARAWKITKSSVRRVQSCIQFKGTTYNVDPALIDLQILQLMKDSCGDGKIIGPFPTERATRAYVDANTDWANVNELTHDKNEAIRRAVYAEARGFQLWLALEGCVEERDKLIRDFKKLNHGEENL